MKHLFVIPIMIGMLCCIPTKEANAQVIPPPRVQVQNTFEINVNFRLRNDRRIVRRIERAGFNVVDRSNRTFTTDIQVASIQREIHPERRRSRVETIQYAVYFKIRKVGRRSVRVSGYYFKLDPSRTYAGLSGNTPPSGLPPEPWKNITGPRSGFSDYDRNAYDILRRFANALKL